MNEKWTFDCPNCGAPLDFAADGEPIVHCPYCDTSVVIPAELRTEPSVVISVNSDVSSATPPTERSLRKSVTIFLMITAVIICVTLMGIPPTLPLVFSGFGLEIPEELERFFEDESGRPEEMKEWFEEVSDESFAEVDFTFGGQGTGPGLFTDARYVGVDGEGNLYVGEHEEGGRVQVFDASGGFVRLWYLKHTEAYVEDLAVDRQGVVYVVQGGQIYRYDGPTGGLLGQVAYAGGGRCKDVAVMADGGLVAAWWDNRDDLVRFDAQGQVVWTLESAISGQTGDAELNTRVAVDGLGNIYALGTFHDVVFKFAPDGQFITRFGSEGEAPGQFRAPHAIAVDGQGRVYISDLKGVQVFDAEGRYLDLIEVDGPGFGMTFNAQNELFVAARHRVIKYVLRPPQAD